MNARADDPAARRPPARCLHTLHADVTDALADGGERALRWALKRCLRAAFERERKGSSRRTLTERTPEGQRTPGAPAAASASASASDASPRGGEMAAGRCVDGAGAALAELTSSESDSGVGADTCRYFYTRDLYHCAAMVSDARPELGEDLAAALVAAVHGPRAVGGALWWASGSALCVRLRDAIV